MSPATILVVDDAPENLTVLSGLLSPDYLVRAANSGERALQLAVLEPLPDLVLLDVMMPGMDGYEVLDRLKADPRTRDVPVIFVTAMNGSDAEQSGLESGAVDYITKPICPPVVLARVRTQIELKVARDRLAGENGRLEECVAQRTEELRKALATAESVHAAMRKSYFGTLLAIGALVELRAQSIGAHARRVANVSRQAARVMGLGEEEIQDVFVAALLHDVGKIGFSEALLHKSVGTMTAEQLAMYRRHPALGAEALGRIEVLADISAIVRGHHEHYDGSGFPDGASGLEIPLGARIICAVSDFDDLCAGALTAVPMTARQARHYLLEERGRRYDPAVIDRLGPLLDADEGDDVDEIRVTAGHLQEGMMLTRDVMHPDGFLLLSKSTTLSRRAIEQLAAVEKEKGRILDVFVLRDRVWY